MTNSTLDDNFAGWRGIVWCAQYDTRERLLKPLAERAAADFALLADRARVPNELVTPGDLTAARKHAWRQGYLGLCCELKCTRPRSRREPSAVVARLAYVALLESALEPQAEAGSVNARPRSGKLELWSQSVIGSGPDPQLIAPFADHVEIEIRKALALFVKHVQPRDW